MLLFLGCKKDNLQDETLDSQMSEELIQLIDDCPTTNYKDIRAFGFQYKEFNLLDNLFSVMCNQALFLTDDISYGEQKGLAYVWGYGIPQSLDKDYRIPRIGSTVDGKECKCQEPLYGLDCSGFIAHVMNAAGIKGLSQMTANQQVKHLKSLTELSTTHYKGKIKVEEIKNVSTSTIRNGDIIYRTNSKNKVNHIGIFFKTLNGKTIMFQSSGSPDYSCQENRHENGRGPIQKELSNENLNKYFKANSGKAHVLRIIPDSFLTLGNVTSHNLFVSATTGTSDGYTTTVVEIMSIQQPHMAVSIVAKKKGTSMIGTYSVSNDYDNDFCQIWYNNDEYSGECSIGSFRISEINDGYEIVGEGMGAGNTVSFYYQGPITITHH